MNEVKFIPDIPHWMDKDGYILKVLTPGDSYKGTFEWIPAFDVMIHSTPARTKGHEFEIAVNEEMWAMVAQFKEDLRREFESWFQ